MNTLIKLFPFFVFCLTNTSAIAQAEGLKTISEEELLTHVEFLASDSLQGRMFGTEVPGLDIAADYLALEASKIGLKPGGETYFQPVAMVYSRVEDGQASLVINEKNGTQVFDTDMLIGFYKGSETLAYSGELIFAGFGHENEETGYDDFEGIDVRDKVVLYATGTPESFLKEARGETAGYSNQLERAKWAGIMGKGAKGIILTTSPYDKEDNLFKRIRSWMQRPGYALKADNEDSRENNIVLVTPSIFDGLKGEGALLQALENRAENRNTEENPLEGFTAEVSLSYEAGQLAGKNVIGIVEGSDPVLKDECIVFMAHYDHLGVDENGDVFNGADDNASGIATLLEVAEAFMSLNKRPKRSIVFLWVTCEEVGMLGSEYYTKHPVFPLENTLACINLDMVGRVYEKSDDVWKRSPKLVRDFKTLFALSDGNSPWLVEISDEAFKKAGLVPDKSLPSQFLRSSDHYHFYEKGVPILNYSTGYHADYHEVTDEVSKISFKKMKKVAELCFWVGFELANHEDK